MYVVIIDEGFGDRKEKVSVFLSIGIARESVDRYAERTLRHREDHDIVTARLYRVGSGGGCVLIDSYCDEALKDGYAEGWKSEGRREVEHQQWEAERQAEREWRAKYVAIPIERHAD